MTRASRMLMVAALLAVASLVHDRNAHELAADTAILVHSLVLSGEVMP